MSDNKWLLDMSFIQTPEQREIARLKTELAQCSDRASKAEFDLRALRELFRLGWKESEDQWRLSRDVVLASDAWAVLR